MDQTAPNKRELTDAPSGCSVRATVLGALPRRLVKYRHLRHLSQSTLARLAGVARSTINAIESGQATDIKLGTIGAICGALGVSIDALLGLYDVTFQLRIENAGKDRNCGVCSKLIPALELHLPGECMTELSNSGSSDRRIGIAFGLPTSVVSLLLREEHAARRRRVF